MNGRQESVCRYTLDGTTILLHDKISCTYDAEARLSGVQSVHLINRESVSYTQTYVYDALGRVRGYNGNGITTEYEYNPMGTLKTAVSTNGSVSLNYAFTYEGTQIKDEDGDDLEYLLTGRVSGYEFKAKNGNTEKSSAKYTYSYDAAGNITEIRLGGDLISKYSYDNLGQLVREENAVSGKI